MRILFIGRKNFTNHCFANWIGQYHELVGYFQADITRYSSDYRQKWLQRRIKRGGLLKTVDQMMYTLYYRAFQYETNQKLMREVFLNHFGQSFFRPPPDVPYYAYEDLNSPEALETLRELQPAVVFAVCISQYLKKAYMQVPRYGTVLYHEGLTPEYKGLHTAFWANYNGEPDRIGYTLLRLNEQIDGGQPIAQGVGDIKPDMAPYWVCAGHKALMDGLPDVKLALDALETGHEVEIRREFGPEHMYTYPGLTHELQRVVFPQHQKDKHA